MKRTSGTILWVVVLVVEYFIANNICHQFPSWGWLPQILVFLVVFVAGDLLVTFILSKVMKVSYEEAWDFWMTPFRHE